MKGGLSGYVVSEFQLHSTIENPQTIAKFMTFLRFHSSQITFFCSFCPLYK